LAVVTQSSPSSSTTMPNIEISSSSTQSRRNGSIIVRKTLEADLSDISDLLTYESSGGGSNNNWMMKLNKLKTRASYLTQIQQRHRATEAATKVLHRFEGIANHRESCKRLWSNDDFRSKLERAVETSSSFEGTDTVWGNHNFALLPPNPSMINHLMMTTVDLDYFPKGHTRHEACIVGFCEIAMLPIPNGGYSPCIINLVVSPNHRRKGIASRMIRNAERFVKLNWLSTPQLSHALDYDVEEDTFKCYGILGLYVDESNKNAISLYLKEDFKRFGHHEKSPNMLFFKKEMHISE